MENEQLSSNQNLIETENQQQISSSNTKLFVIVAVSVLLTAIIVGPAVYSWQKLTSEKTISSLEQKISSLEEQISIMKKAEIAPEPTSVPPVLSPTSTTDSEEVWKSYSNKKYNFSIRYPKGWKYLEVPTSTYQTETDQLWIDDTDFPPPQTGARSDITFIFTRTDPASNWQPQYFDNFKSEDYALGSLPATKITGVNKEGLNEELVVIAKIGEAYIQVLSNHSPASLQYFDQILSTFKLLN